MNLVEAAIRLVLQTDNQAWSRVTTGWIPGLMAPLAWLRPRRTIAFAWPAEPIPLGPNVAIFVHFDRAGGVREHVLHYVRALGEAGFSVVVVSNSGKLTPSGLAALQDVAAGVLVRRNVGYDFGAWREALERLGLPRADTRCVALVNDSVYGPFAPLAPVLRRIDFNAADVWGLTDSWQRRYHLQSYFLCVGRAALDSAAWRLFWNRVRPLPSKHSIIQTYEVGLTQALLRGGLRCQAVWSYRDLVNRAHAALPVEAAPTTRRDEEAPSVPPLNRQQRRIRGAIAARAPLNPTSDLWRQLILARYPFIKRELLRDNPGGVADLSDWRDLLRQKLRADTSAVDLDLQRTLRNRAP